MSEDKSGSWGERMYCRADLLSRRTVFIIDPTFLPGFLFSFWQAVHFSVMGSVSLCGVKNKLSGMHFSSNSLRNGSRLIKYICRCRWRDDYLNLVCLSGERSETCRVRGSKGTRIETTLDYNSINFENNLQNTWWLNYYNLLPPSVKAALSAVWRQDVNNSAESVRFVLDSPPNKQLLSLSQCHWLSTQKIQKCTNFIHMRMTSGPILWPLHSFTKKCMKWWKIFKWPCVCISSRGSKWIWFWRHQWLDMQLCLPPS